jgi:hypothetical protein
VEAAVLSDGLELSVPVQLAGFDLSNAFDPKLLATGPGDDRCVVVVADAARVRGQWLDEQGERTTEAAFELPLALLDPKLRWASGRAVLVGIDVFQGCGLFVRSAQLEPGLPPVTSMSDCLVNFSGALSDAVPVPSGLALLVGERTMTFDASDSVFESFELQNSDHDWQQSAALGWNDEGGLIVAAREQGLLLERVDTTGTVSDRRTLDEEGVEPVAVTSEPVTGEWWWFGVREQSKGATASQRGSVVMAVHGPDLSDRLALTPITEQQVELSDLVVVGAGRSARLLWLASTERGRQVFHAAIDCTP